MIMKKLMASLLLLCLVLSVTIVSALAETTITFAFWDKNQEPGMQAIADAYMAAHPDVKIELQHNGWGEYWTVLEATAIGGGMPDVFWIHSNEFFKYASAGTLLSLDDLDLDYSPYPAGVTALYNYKGQQLAVPKDYDTIALAYNKEIFDAAGVAYPDDTWDWAKLREVAIALTDAEAGVYGFAAPQDTQSGYYNFVYQNGGFIFENGVPGFDQEATQEALQFYVDLMLVDGVSPDVASFGDLSANDQFKNGKVAMILVGSWNMSDWTSNDFIKDKFDLAVLPQGKARASIYNGLGYAVAGNSANPDVAKDFAAFCGSEEANILQAKAKSAIPAYAGTEHYFVDLFTKINIGAYPEMIEYGVQFPFGPFKSLWAPEETEWISTIYSGENSVADACNALNAKIIEIEAEWAE